MANSAAEEMVQIVDADDIPVAAVPRRVMREARLIHRAASILVFNSSGDLFLQKRSLSKDVYPGYWDLAAGGVVLAGESYEHSARRELEEELGVFGLPLRYLFDHYHEDAANRVWARVFTCTCDGPFRLQKEEILCGRFMAPAAIQALHPTLPLTPDGLAILRRFLA